MHQTPPSKRVPPFVRTRSVATALLVLGWGCQASAQESNPAPAESTTQASAPVLERFVEARYPEEALDARIEGRVVLELTVDAEGRVAEASVVQGLGHGLDDAARAAALEFSFAPAQQGGRTRAARILYAYDFRLPSIEEAPPKAPVGEAPPNAPVAEAPPKAPEPDETTPSPVEVLVRGHHADDRLVRSAAAVTVVNMER